MKFNKRKCLQLLKEKNQIEEKGQLLGQVDPVKNKILVKYLRLLEDEIFWQDRKAYHQVVYSFIHDNITLEQFFAQFFKLRGKNLGAVNAWQKDLKDEARSISNKSNKIELNSQSAGFGMLIAGLYDDLSFYNPDITAEELQS